MKIKILQSLAGNGFTIPAGSIIDKPSEEANRMIEAGIAEKVTTKKVTNRKQKSTLDK